MIFLSDIPVLIKQKDFSDIPVLINVEKQEYSCSNLTRSFRNISVIIKEEIR